MKNLYLGVLLAPYRLDYYNYISEHMNCDIYFQLKGFEGQLFSTEELENKCIFTPKYLKITRMMGDRQVVWGLRKLIKENKPEFVIVPEFSFLAMQVILIKKLFGYKYKIISQCDDSYAMLMGKGFSRFHAWSRKLCMPFIDNLILLDSRARTWYQQHYHKGIFIPLLTDDKTACFNDDVRAKAEQYKSHYELDGVKTLLFVGRLVDVKNLSSLLKACSLLSFDYKLIIVGEGLLRDSLENEATELNVNVEFVGRKNGVDLTAWYCCADVFVLPSIMEAFGAVTNEALLGGCNCVISKLAGSACLIKEGVNGFLADPYSVDDVAKQIDKACQLPIDSARSSKMFITFADAIKSMEEEINRKVLRVFHVISHLEVGGAERVALNIAESTNKDFEYHIVEVKKGSSAFSAKMKTELEEHGIRFHSSPIVNRKLAILLFPFWFSCVYLKYRPNVIHSHTEIPDLSLWLFRKLSWMFWGIKARYVRTIHNTELWNDWKWIGGMVERFYLKHKCNVAISKAVRDTYEKSYGQHGIPLIYNGVKEMEQIAFPHLVKGKVNVLFAGRLEPQKGIDQLIAVVTALKNDGRYHFHIVGSGSLERKVKESLGGQDYISLYDKVYGLSQYMGSFDFLFMSSNHEGLGLISVEASLARTPVIVNWCAGVDETLPKDWPLKVMNNNAEDFVDLFQNRLQSMDYQELVDMAYKYVIDHFSLERMRREYEKIYKDI